MAADPTTLKVSPNTITQITAIKRNGTAITPITYNGISSSSYSTFTIGDFLSGDIVTFSSQGYSNLDVTIGTSDVVTFTEGFQTIAFYKHAGVTYEIEDEKARQDIATKQDALTAQTTYSAKGSSTKVPQITTNNLGQVTNITEVTITQPTVNNKTITIQKNSTTVDSFTLNQSTNKTINITVPTTAADVGAVSTTDGVTGVVTGSTADKINVTKNGSTSTITVNNVANAIEATKVTTQASNTNADATIFFAKANSSNKEIAYDNDFKYNPNTNKLTVNNIDGKINGDNYVSWGGPNLSGNVSPTDAGCIDDFGHNKAAYWQGAIDIEYTTDGGETWIDYGKSDNDKWALVTRGGSTVTIGKGIATVTNGLLTNDTCANYKARITLHTRNSSGTAKFYSSIRKLLLNVSTNGASGTNVVIQTRTIGDYNNNVDTWSNRGTYSVSGWSGWNSIPINGALGGGSTQTSQWADLRIILSITGVSTSASNANISDIRIIGVTNWSVDSFAASGHMYTFDKDKNVTFPNKVTASTGGFVGNLTGTADKATKDGDGNTISSTYLKLSGGTMTGGLKFGTSAIPQETDPQYMLSMDAFASGGAVKWVSVANNKAGKDANGNTITTTYATKSELPTVNNKTITIQKNSTTVDSFTLNQSTDKTINISVPTKTSDLQNDSGFLTSHQSIKTLKTDNTTAQSTSSSEAIAGSGTINLHKVSKTGSYNDLLNKPTIPATNVIPATTTANKVLLSTTTSGTAKWSDFSSAGLLKTNTSGVVSVDTTSYGTYSKPSGGIPSTDLAESYYLASNPSGYTSNAGTVTSVRVQAGTGLSSSTSTAQNTTLNTTISIASGYKLPTTTEWGNKQDALTTQTAYTSKGSATKVPQITTNTLGQVTGITEVDITHPTELPSQTGQSGKFLTTNGSAVSWATVQAGPKFLFFTNVSASSWVVDNTYQDYGYKCELTCNGVTSSDYAQVIFGPTQATNGNYANLCLTGTDSVTIYSKVNTAITIPTIFIIGSN